ncbi:PLD nuclease N-terminal domain-containing protein [Nocardiopsis sp. L17-MgMaSL7]|uniref:PLD nuclease N-terminal domain-containing protein n=1 Tax=Nocardiopsis sp. L17-MgMaSL7 TaxID=1938893 RepID=UPI000D7104FE|nr:PLD nuclease N-terminal domain-containing protein [Nocardiopsis sp. L17-MgMaSL7]PWV55365.1 phospholipase D-like protein [Nocardiopsis sp. L17-MgMaSL7]
MTMWTLADLTPVDIGVLTVGLVLTLAAFVLFIAAVFSVLFSRLDVPMKIVWIVFVFAAPLIGALLWFFVGRKRAPAHQIGG